MLSENVIRKTSFLTVVAVGVLFLPALAASISIHVTPANLTAYPIGFTVSAKAIGKTTEYEIVLTWKTTMDPVRFVHPMDGGLVRVAQDKISFGFEGVRSVKKESLNKDRVRYRFRATAAEVSRLSFEVGYPAYTTVAGKRQWMPSADFYYLHLRDFLPKELPRRHK